MTTLILCNDAHFVTKNPVSRVLDANTELFGFLDQVLQIAVKVKAHGIVFAGDLFHDKTERARVPYPVLFGIVQWLAACKAVGIEVFAIPGNHDLLHDRYDSLPSRPLGILFESGLLINFSRRTAVLGNVALYGVPYPDAMDPDAFATVPKVDVVVAHCFATPEGGAIYGDHCHAYADLGKAAPHVRLWHLGHDHSDRGVFTLANGAKIVNIGALSRGALNTDNITRQVKVAIAKIPDDGGPLEVLQVTLRQEPADKIFDLKLRQQKVQETAQIDAFIAQLSQGLLGQAVDYQAALTALPLDKAVRTKVDEYIRRAETI